MALAPGQVLTLVIEKPAAGGWMIARVDRHVVLVAGAIPGERLTARIEKVGKGVAYARTVSVEEPSADRRDGVGDPLCGGCLYAHIDYPRQLDIKSLVIADAFLRIGRVTLPAPVPVAASPTDGYRMRARLHLRGGRAGFFREGTHELCDARATRQLLPGTCDVIDRLTAGLRSLGLGAVSQLEVSENVDASERAVHLDGSSSLDPRLFSALSRTDGVTGLSIGLGPDGVHIVSGDPHVTDALSIDGHTVTLRRHVLSFFQGNRFLLGELVSHIVSQVDPASTVVDLYAGTGLFAVAAAVARGARVVAVEGDRVAARDLAANAAVARGSVQPIGQPVEVFAVNASAQPDTLIVDPPRTGLSNEAFLGAMRLAAARVVYVSCDVATLARDARRLLDAGYRIEHIHAFDLFPNTPHVETVVMFART